MVFEYRLKNGTYKDWLKLQKKYPDKWAVMHDVKFDDEDNVIKFNLLEICDFKDTCKAYNKYVSKDHMLYIERLTYADEFT